MSSISMLSKDDLKLTFAWLAVRTSRRVSISVFDEFLVFFELSRNGVVNELLDV